MISIYFSDDGSAWGAEEYNIDEDELISLAYDFAKESGINILSNKNIHTVLYDPYYDSKDDRNNFIGALWTTDNFEYFSFDIVVAPTHRGKKIADKLIDIALDEYKEQNYFYGEMHDGEELPLTVEVTNPIMEKLLQKRGFKKFNEANGISIYVPAGGHV